MFVIYYFLIKYKVKLFEFDQIGFLEKQNSSIQMKERENLAKKKKKRNNFFKCYFIKNKNGTFLH